MQAKTIKKEGANIPITVDVPYRFAAGSYLAKFLIELRDNGDFYGIKCPVCGRVQVPPRVVCAMCHVENTQWIKLKNEGVIKAFTTMYMPLTDPTTGKAHEPPFAYGTVKLDGSDSGIDHMINPSVDPATIKVGMRVKAVLRPKDQRIGDLCDILYFDPIEDEITDSSGDLAMPEQNEYGTFEVDQHIVAECRYYVGAIATQFYELLGSKRKLTGVNCKTCKKVFWPPRATCGRCFSALTEVDLVEIGPEGTLETFTKIDYNEPVHPKQGPLVYGIVKLDGADTGMPHLIKTEDFDTLKTGMRMKPVFSENREGNILDIMHFEPVTI
jgi:uncharacterized OB-fold protein